MMNATVASKSSIQAAVEDLITNYHELNSNLVDELTEEPTPLEFMRYIHANRPFVVRKGASEWAAVRKWDVSYLIDKLGDTAVNVACTPLGNADSVLQLPDGTLCFVKPHVVLERFAHAVCIIQHQEKQNEFDEAKRAGPIRYLQTQNDNLRGEYGDIFEDVPRDIPFARIALRTAPDAVNFWLGNSWSTTALHKDNYENIYVQILGQKHFLLLPPVEAACANERELPAATYRPAGPGNEQLIASLDDPPAAIPFATWDPDEPGERATFASPLSRPVRVTLGPGDMLYLPAQWYHKVKQDCGKDAVCVAVNYWYDMEFAGAFHSMASFVRDIGRASCSPTA